MYGHKKKKKKPLSGLYGGSSAVGSLALGSIHGRTSNTSSRQSTTSSSRSVDFKGLRLENKTGSSSSLLGRRSNLSGSESTEIWRTSTTSSTRSQNIQCSKNPNLSSSEMSRTLSTRSQNIRRSTVNNPNLSSSEVSHTLSTRSQNTQRSNNPNVKRQSSVLGLDRLDVNDQAPGSKSMDTSDLEEQWRSTFSKRHSLDRMAKIQRASIGTASWAFRGDGACASARLSFVDLTLSPEERTDSKNLILLDNSAQRSSQGSVDTKNVSKSGSATAGVHSTFFGKIMNSIKSPASSRPNSCEELPKNTVTLSEDINNLMTSFESDELEKSDSKAQLKQHLTREDIDRKLDMSHLGDNHLINSHNATLFFATIILLNVLVIGLESELRGNEEEFSHDQTTDDIWFGINTGFLAIFSIELCLRIHADGCDAFRSKWNLCDMVVITVGIVEVIGVVFLDWDTNIGILSIMRTCRLMRVVKVLRFFKALYLLLKGIVNAMRMIGWMLILMGTVIYLFAVMARQLVVDSNVQDPYFSDVLTSMLTFFQLVTMDKWNKIHAQVKDESPLLGFSVIAFIFFTNLLLLNCITGVMVENTLEVTRNDEDGYMLSVDAMKTGSLAQFRELMDMCDAGKTGFIGRAELQELLELDDEVGPGDAGRASTSSGESQVTVTKSSSMKSTVSSLQEAFQTIKRTAEVVKLIPALDLLKLFDLVERNQQHRKKQPAVKIDRYLDIVARCIGTYTSATQALDAVTGWKEIYNLILRTSTKNHKHHEEIINRACAYISKETDLMISTLQGGLKEWFQEFEEHLGSRHRVTVELLRQKQSQLQDVKRQRDAQRRQHISEMQNREGSSSSGFRNAAKQKREVVDALAPLSLRVKILSHAVHEVASLLHTNGARLSAPPQPLKAVSTSKLSGPPPTD